MLGIDFDIFEFWYLTVLIVIFPKSVFLSAKAILVYPLGRRFLLQGFWTPSLIASQ